MENTYLSQILDFIGQRGWLIAVLIGSAQIILLWVFSAFSFRVACWFTLIEAKLTQCFKLTLSLFLTKLALCLTILISFLLYKPSVPTVACISILTACFFIVRSITRTFDCKKRSAVTLMIMAAFSAEFIMIALITSFFAASSAATLIGSTTN